MSSSRSPDWPPGASKRRWEQALNNAHDERLVKTWNVAFERDHISTLRARALDPLAKTGEELPDGGDGLLAQPGSVVLVVGFGQEQRVGVGAILAGVAEAFFEERQRLVDLLVFRDRTCGRHPSCGARASLVVQESEDHVVRVFVLVAVLEREDLEHRVRQHARHAHRDARMPTGVEPLALDVALDEVITDEMSTANVERAQLRPRGFALWAEDAPGRDLVGLTEKFDGDLDAIDLSRPSKAWLLLLEAGVLQVVLEGAIRLRRLVAESESDDEVDVGGSDVCACTFWKLSDEIPRGEAAREVDALPPWAKVPSRVTRARSQRAVVSSL